MKRLLIFSIVVLIPGYVLFAQVPDGFVNVQDIDSTIQVELRYFTTNNFLGTKVRGYKANKAYLTERAAKALYMAHRRARKLGMGILIFDSYRPQQAVDHFVEWSKDLSDTLKKTEFYPEIKKSRLFQEGFIASKSGHSRGSTVDLTLYFLETGEAVDMGSRFDLFSDKSFHNSPLVTPEQLANRNLLKQLMQNAGFRPYSKEWWHYTLNNEPFKDQYFNFEVK